MRNDRFNGVVARRVGAACEAGALGALGDGELLERFATRRGEAAELAFAVLVERHGPMVLRACRAGLGDPHAAQDAFQSTFLVLARRAGTLWVRDSLGPWLHSVACRTAAGARVAEGRRRALERRAAGRAEARATDPPGDEVGPALHEEVERLPERLRRPVVLCYLEGLTHDEAADRLGCPVGTVRSRLARGRDRLRRGLTRRGLAPAAPTPAPVVPPMLAGLVARSAARLATDRVAAGTVARWLISLAEGVHGAMSIHPIQSTVAALLLASGVVAVGFGAGAGQEPKPDARPTVVADPGPKPTRVEDTDPTKPLSYPDINYTVDGRLITELREANRRLEARVDELERKLNGPAKEGPVDPTRTAAGVDPTVEISGTNSCAVGETIAYKVTLANRGQATARRWKVLVKLPREGGRLKPGPLPPGSKFETNSRTLVWNTAPLEAGQVIQMAFDYQTTTVGSYRAVVRVVDATSDQFLRDASLTTEVTEPFPQAFRKVRTRLDDALIEKVIVAKGQAVKKGDPLVEIRSLELVRAKTDCQTKYVQHDHDLKYLVAREPLAKEGRITQIVWTDTQNDEKKSRLDYLVARDKLATFGMPDDQITKLLAGLGDNIRSLVDLGIRDLSTLTIVAPVDGEVGEVKVEPGDLATSKDVLLLIATPKP